MKSLILRLLAALFTRPLIAANDHEITVANALGGEGVFELQQDGRWFIPFGDYPHAIGLQKFDATAANDMAAAFASGGGIIRRLFTKPSVPIYAGHPDMPGRADSDPSAPALGWVESIAVENDGMSLGVKLNEAGLAAVNGAAFRFYSPVWQMKKVPGGLRPVRLQSLGLTNNPRIPVPAIANDDEPAKPAPVAPEITAALGLDAGAPLADVLAAIAALTSKGAESGDAMKKADDMAAENAASKAALAAANDALATLRAQLTAANDAAVAARRARATDAITALVASGRVLQAEREQRIGELIAANDETAYTALVTALGAADAKLKTKPVTTGLGDAKSKLITATNDASAARNESRRAAIAEAHAGVKREHPRMTPGAAYDLATQRVRNTRPELF